MMEQEMKEREQMGLQPTDPGFEIAPKELYQPAAPGYGEWMQQRQRPELSYVHSAMIQEDQRFYKTQARPPFEAMKPIHSSHMDW